MRYFGADVNSALKTLAGTPLNAVITTIQTERGDAGFELIRKVNVGICERQYPECVIMLQDSELKNEEITLDITDTPEIYPAEITVIYKDNTDKIADRGEYYIEALQRIFHGYKDSNISFIEVSGTIRADAYTEQKEVLKVAGVKLNVRIL